MHTPGPWTRQDDDTYSPASLCDQRIVGADRISPAIIFGGIGEATANARLIAAAPDLLAALKAIVEHQQINGANDGRIRYLFDYNSPLGQQARYAIKKAEHG